MDETIIIFAALLVALLVLSTVLVLLARGKQGTFLLDMVSAGATGFMASLVITYNLAPNHSPETQAEVAVFVCLVMIVASALSQIWCIGSLFSVFRGMLLALLLAATATVVSTPHTPIVERLAYTLGVFGGLGLFFLFALMCGSMALAKFVNWMVSVLGLGINLTLLTYVLAEADQDEKDVFNATHSGIRYAFGTSIAVAMGLYLLLRLCEAEDKYERLTEE